jgi:hypothetical protein
MRIELATIAKAYSECTAWLATTQLKRMSTPEGPRKIENFACYSFSLYR